VFAKVAKVKGRRSKDVWLALALLSAVACQRPTEKQREPHVVWHRIGAWSGVGSLQTESFESAGSLRVQWKTANESAPGTGTFRLAFHSSISGRELQVAVDRKGTGADTAYVQQDPHVFFAKVESANLEWSFTVDEAVTMR
jgi:hypothetical protein